MSSMLGIASRILPSSLKPLAKRFYYRYRHPIHPSLKRFGTVQDRYYWVSDGDLDTVLQLQNYFSAFFPELETSTSGSISLFDENGVSLGSKTFSVAHQGSTKFRVSALVADLQVSSTATFGSLEVKMAIPKNVLEHVRSEHSLYFWDRFYIGYSNNKGQMCFVHGVDKTHIYHEGSDKAVNWYGTTESYEWAPEMPVNIHDYERFSVIMLNRTSKTADVTLTMLDSYDESLKWSAEIPPKGVHRFELSMEDTRPLAPTELRMRVEGMPTKFGRPMVFKEFRNGAFSAMHC
jgi:hypothetical protein